MKKKSLLAGLAALALPFAIGGSMTAFADTTSGASPVALALPTPVYVSPSGSDTSGDGSQAKPYQTISYAVNQASFGGAVIVEPGTYKEMVVITKDVTLESDSTQADAVQNTVIDATGQQNGILLKGFAASGSNVIGLTVENAQQAGILAVGPITALTFEGNVVTNNAIGPIPPHTDFEALHLMGATHSTIINNQVVNNADGGIYLTDETGPSSFNFIINNTVTGNKVDCGITLASHVAKSGVFDNIVEGNDSEDNGAAGVFMGTPVPGGAVYNNVVKGNTVKDNNSGGIVMHTHAPGSIVTNNIIFDNTISGNQADAGVTSGSVGVSIGASLSPISKTLVFGNAISNETYNVYISDEAQNTFSMQNQYLPF